MDSASFVRAAPQDIRAEYERLLNPSSSLAKIKEAAINGQLFTDTLDRYDTSNGMLPGRSIAWKLFLLPTTPLTSSLSPTPASPIHALREARERYVQLLKQEFRAPDGSYEDWLEIPGFDTSPPKVEQSIDNWSRNNPLSLDIDSGWHEWFNAVDIRKTIRQDVERTFPDIPYFRDLRVQSLLTTILYVHAQQNPHIGYRQGMHELLAPLLYAVDFDSLDPSLASSSSSDHKLAELCDRTWVAADAHAMFTIVMAGVGSWYEWREPLTDSVIAAGPVEIKPYVAPIVTVCNTIYTKYLKNTDPALWDALQRSQIEPQIYGIRWLRLLFTREFVMSDAMILWDGLFAMDASLQMSKWICVAMLIRIRNLIIPTDYSGQLTHLLRYPSEYNSSSGSIPHVSLLLQQAQSLRSSPLPASGASVVIQNRNILGIPVEVPDSPIVSRRPSRRSAQSSGTSASGSRPGSVGKSFVRNNGHSGGQRDQRRDQFGFPDILAKGLSDINGVVSSTVSEIRRSFPDLQTSLARIATPEIAFPYQSMMLTPEERPPWEPRTRFEIEREMHAYQALQKRLGVAVSWAVDALLQSEDQEEEAETRKREALECLSYVRDILNLGKVPKELDEERLVGETEMRRRRVEQEAKEAEAKEQKPELDARTLPNQDSRVDPAPKVPSHSISPSALPIPLPTSSNTGRPRTYLSTRDFTPVSTIPRIPHSTQPTLSSRPSAHPYNTISPPSSTHRPPAAPIPPWESTPSAFDAPAAGASIRKPPPISSPGVLPGSAPPPNAGPPLRRSESSTLGRRYADSPQIDTVSSPSQTYQSDPLRG